MTTIGKGMAVGALITIQRRSNDVRSRIYRDDGLGRGVGIKIQS